MKFSAIFTAFALVGSAFASPAATAQKCSNKYRRAYLDGVAPAFSDQTPGATAKFLQSLPLDPQATLTIYINGLPGIEVGPNAASVRTFALGVRQIFYKVVPTSNPSSVAYPNGTAHTELEITTGPRVVAFPANIHAGMNFNYELPAGCTLGSLQGFLTVPSSVLGVPVDITAITKQLQAIADDANNATGS